NLKKEITKQNPKEETKGKFNRYIELLEDRSPDINNDMILPYIPNEYLGSIIDYFKDDSIIFINESRRIEENFKSIEENLQMQFTDLLEVGEILPSHFNMNYEYGELVREIKRKTIITNSSLLGNDRNFPPKAIESFAVKSTTNYHNKVDLLAEDIEDYKYRGYKIIILAGTEERALRLQKNLREFKVESSFSKDRSEEIKSGQLFITTGSVQDGFEYSDIKLMIISDREIFGAQNK